jgi:release factor glutamine methyltransferase
MTINDALKQGNSILLYAEVDTPALDCTLLLAESLGITKERLYASLHDEIDEHSFGRYRELLDKRCSGYPVSYILKRKEFYGLEFFVDERVLVPRPDTETVVETVAGLVEQGEMVRSLLDVCTGSGCIAITLKKLLPFLEATGADISPCALEVLAINAARILGSRMPAVVSDLLSGIEGTFDCIVANPPYLTESEARDMKKIGWPEPPVALAGGKTGAELTLRLVVQAKRNLNRPGWLVLESSPAHMETLAASMAAEGYCGVFVKKDLRGLERVIAGRLDRHG